MHSTASGVALKAAVALALLIPITSAQPPSPATRPALRDELTALLAAGRIEQAVTRAQQAWRVSPQDAEVRSEYARLHVALAQHWLTAGRTDDALTALRAALAATPHDRTAAQMLRAIQDARRQVAAGPAELDRLLRFELFDAALDQLRALTALAPDRAADFARQTRSAWAGAADDHYLARNFPEAVALYEQALALGPAPPGDLEARWTVALALALAEAPADTTLDTDSATRLLARVARTVVRTRQAALGQVIAGLVAEQAGRPQGAGRAYAAALGAAWEPTSDEARIRSIQELRCRAIELTRALYGETTVPRRTGVYAAALTGAWKHRQTPHFDVYARNDLLAELMADAAEFHLPGLAAWLGVESPGPWTPRCEVRVYADLAELRAATGLNDAGTAYSRTRVRGDRIESRQLALTQDDPWLLSATLPHELCHVLLAAEFGSASPPLAIEEGLALLTEPPARKLMYRRLLPASIPQPEVVLAVAALPTDADRFYAQGAALTSWLLERLADRARSETAPPPVPCLLARLKSVPAAPWWQLAGAADADAVRRIWEDWYAAQRTPLRMPLLLRVGNLEGSTR